MKVWFPKPLGDEVITQLQAMAPEVDISREHDPDAKVLIEGRPEREQIESCPELKAVIVPFAGVSPGLLKLMEEFPGVSLHNLHHNAPDTAETALALLMAAAKWLVPMDQDLRRNDWSLRYQPEKSRLLAGRTAVILGFGEVGRRIGRILEAMDMTVVGVRRARSGEPNVYGIDQLHEVLPRAQVLIVTIPLTPETDQLIGQDEINSMPDGAILINVARGAVVEERALFEALKSGKLHSGGADVWYRYPAEEGTAVPTYFEAPPSARNTAPANYPFGDLPNFVLSPHRGGANDTTETHRVEHLARLLREFAEGKPMPNRVSLDRGY